MPLLPNDHLPTGGEMRALIAPLFKRDMEDVAHVWILMQPADDLGNIEVIGCPKHAMWAVATVMGSVQVTFPDGFGEDEPCR